MGEDFAVRASPFFFPPKPHSLTAAAADGAKGVRGGEGRRDKRPPGRVLLYTHTTSKQDSASGSGIVVALQGRGRGRAVWRYWMDALAALFSSSSSRA